ncbi:MAG: Bax inhibitor-1/YccA family protein [Deltaproteobacteria bacterium]|nr:Bax inhibitor-1/YccA family protein [Deltaproteobacteria bacterium]
MTNNFITAAAVQDKVRINEFIKSVYNWMAIGLGLTGLIAYYVSNNEAIMQLIYGNMLVFFGIIICELLLVVSISRKIDKISALKATSYFMLYAVLNGITISWIFLAYTHSSIASVFFICSGTFAGCSIYGMVTKRDLTSLGGFAMMGLFGILIASVVNIFLQSSGMSMIISYIGVLVFVGLTAYDTQELKKMALAQPAGLEADVIRKGAILGALKLYLDFINLFIMFLRIFGVSRD